MTRRIGFISEHASPEAKRGGVAVGGQNIYVRQMAKHLARLGYEVDVFTRKDSPDLPPVCEMERGVRVVHVPAGPPCYVPKEEMLPLMKEFTEHMLAACSSRRGYDLLHANFWMSGLVAAEVKRVLGVPFVITFHALGRVRHLHLQEADGFPEDRFAVEDRIVAEADRVLAECPEDETDLIRLYDANPERLRMAPCGFDPEELFPVGKEVARAALGLPQDARLLLQVGRIVPRKGVDNVIRGLGRLVHQHGRDTRLIIAGASLADQDERMAKEVERLLAIADQEDVADLVSFAGYVKREQLKYFYSAADLFLTTPWYEPFGITPLEAMACGTPVIGSNVSGIKYTVRDGETGGLVPPNDPDALAARAAEILAYPSLLERMGQRAIKHVNAQFTWRHVAATAAGIYEEVAPHAVHTARSRYVVDGGLDELLYVVEATKRLRPAIEVAANAIAACFENGNKVLVCGNGGSAAEAQHLAGELMGRFRAKERRALPVIALTADSAVLTGWANDAGYEYVFARQIEALGHPGDLLVGLSTSGNSPNLLRAFQTARAHGMICLSLCAGNGGSMHPLDDLAILLPTTDPQRAQEVHLTIVHLLCELVEQRLAQEAMSARSGGKRANGSRATVELLPGGAGVAA